MEEALWKAKFFLVADDIFVPSIWPPEQKPGLRIIYALNIRRVNLSCAHFPLFGGRGSLVHSITYAPEEASELNVPTTGRVGGGPL